jgi:phosphate transport system substrate-binding protein
MSKFISFVSILLCASVLFSCNNSQSKKASETPTAGNIKISVDESYKSIMDSQIYTFQKLYTKAFVTAAYTTESQAFKDLLNDSSRLIIVSRKPSKNENDFIKQKNTKLRVTKLVVDGLALIVNPENSDTLINEAQLTAILQGKITTWSELGITKNMSKIALVFDSNEGANARYLKDSLLKANVFSTACFALKNNQEVIDYIAKNKNAIGVISVNWISDRDDPNVETFLSKIKLMSVGNDDDYDHRDFVKPFQAYLATKEYPLWRSVYAILREPRNGLGTGFVSFIAGEKGQRMFLKAGLVPINVPIRFVEVTTNNIE